MMVEEEELQYLEQYSFLQSRKVYYHNGLFMIEYEGIYKGTCETTFLWVQLTQKYYWQLAKQQDDTKCL